MERASALLSGNHGNPELVTQCVLTFNSVLSGESGAGKTESCKFIVTHLTELSHAKSLVEQRIIQVCLEYC